MKADDIQTVVICGLFGVMGAGVMYRSLQFSESRTPHSRRYVFFKTLVAGLGSAAMWVLLGALDDLLPKKWSDRFPTIVLAIITALAIWKPGRTSKAEDDSTHRIQIGILAGGAVLIVICAIVFWPGRY